MSARAFLTSNAAGQRDPAFQTTGFCYDPLSTDHYVRPGADGIQARAKAHQERFLDTMETFKVQFPNAKNFDLHEPRSWSAVLNEGFAAKGAYESRHKGWKGSLFRGSRKIADNASTITTVLERTLPSGEYSSIVCGAVILVFRAFHAVGTVRVMVLKTLKDSPLVLEMAERVQNLYPRRSTLKDAVAEVHLALLAAIMAIVEWLRKHPLKRLSALILQDDYESELKDHVENLQESTERLKAEADLCHKESTKDIAVKIEAIQEDTNVAISLTTNILLMASEINAGVQGLDEKMTDTRTQINTLDTRLGKVGSGVERTEETVQYLLNVVNNLSRQWETTPRYLPPIHDAWPNGQTAVMSIPLLSALDIQSILGDWSEHNSILAEYYSTVASDVGPQTSASIMDSPQFQSWFSSSASQILFVEYDTVDEQVQPGSFVTATLSQALPRFQPAACLTHFCCQTRQYSDGNPETLSDPVTSMLGCLIVELLRQLSIDLGRWAQNNSLAFHKAQLQANDLQYLYSLFKYVVGAISAGTIFCLLDDVQELEREADVLLFLKAFNYLQDVVRSCSQRRSVSFKVLAMTVSKSSVLTSQLQGDVCDWLHVEDSRRQRTRSLEESHFLGAW
ncbi:hypothetical protein M409DRAFT_49080 [Zasmidium cellare ATCC 36951]|uniref:DUF7708 domain-containing protein n=1 Tax=Zasmidium cellare ATCC 36951 TaxID=1080233 RepID=A0A6A6D478_ZASCE|nr:uncharacterized protein M409DRAFT_49080 [Zasmidium cellare ATCC 36951]KAF2174221.1 hypothetical protein M409DRAFT_49080 [Zasmidium cellare ATCC 36951]